MAAAFEYGNVFCELLLFSYSYSELAMVCIGNKNLMVHNFESWPSL